MTMLLKGGGIVLSLCPLMAFAAKPLDFQALDQVTAAGIPAQHHWNQREGETVVARGAMADIDILANTILQDSVQADTRALNVHNTAASDSVSLLNIATLDGLTPQYHIEQVNFLLQDAFFVGRLGSILADGPDTLYTWNIGFRRSAQQGVTDGYIINNRTVTTLHEQESLTAVVPQWDPSKDFTIGLGSWDPGSINLGELSLGGITDTEVAGKYGFEVSTGPVILDGPKIDFGSVRFLNDDIILQPGHFTLPAVDFGTASIEICVAGCLSSSSNLGRVGGNRIGPLAPATLPGANPFKDWNLQAGSGVALIGSGEVSITGPGAYIDLGFTLDINKFLDLGALMGGSISREVSRSKGGDSFSETFSINPADYFGAFPTIRLEERIVLLEGQSEQTFDIPEDGFCFQFGGSGCQAERVITTTATYENDDTTIDLTSRTGNTQMEYWRQETELVFVPAEMAGAEADMIVMTDASLSHNQSNNTLLQQNAQRNLRALNTVNASNAVIGNLNNMITHRNPTVSSTRQTQLNQFVQKL